MYRFCRWLGRVIFFFRRWQVEGLENIPIEGAVILAANHTSNWDPILLGCAVDRVVHYMAKEELFRNWLSRWFFQKLHAFPVKRGAIDRRAIREAIDLLERGEVLGIFPEGTRFNPDGKPQSGVALLAIKGRSPVVPVAIRGNKGNEPLRLIIGQSVSYERYYEARVSSALLEEISLDIMEKILSLSGAKKDSTG